MFRCCVSLVVSRCGVSTARGNHRCFSSSSSSTSSFSSSFASPSTASAVASSPVPPGLEAALKNRVKAQSVAPRSVLWRRNFVDGPLSKAELEAFWEDGFVVKKNLLDPRDLQPSIASIEEIVDELAVSLLKAGKIKDDCKSLDVYKRLTAIEKQFPDASVLLHKKGVLPASFSALWTHPTLLAVARQLVGPDIAGHPVWNLRCKTPQQEQAVVPWHQDAAYLAPDCWDVLQATAWIPLLDATVENGCMQMVRGGHKSGLVCKHQCCVGGTWYIECPEPVMEEWLNVKLPRDIVTCEVPKGGVLFLNNLIPHRSLTNVSKDVRWSLDLRWQHPDLPNGFFGLKDSIKMTDSKNPNFKVDWAGWANHDRTPLQMNANEPSPPKDEFNSVICGPWMGLWPMVHENRHTKAWTSSNGSLSWHAP